MISSSVPIRIPNIKTSSNSSNTLRYLANKISILFYYKGNKMGDSDKKKYGSPIFSWGIHIWNFKTSTCMVLNLCYAQESWQTNKQTRTNEPMNERTSQKQYVPTFFKVGGIKNLAQRFHLSCLKVWIDDGQQMDNDGRQVITIAHPDLRTFGRAVQVPF